MAEIPADVQIQALICRGRTYLFKAQEHHGDKKHFHIVLNSSPRFDVSIIMVTATTISSKHVTDYWSELEQRGVLVQAVEGDAEFIKHPTLFRCDTPIVMSKEIIITKLVDGSLLQKGMVYDPLLSKLRQGLINSKTVTEEIKKFVR
jgi:hypothetical protein